MLIVAVAAAIGHLRAGEEYPINRDNYGRQLHG